MAKRKPGREEGPRVKAPAPYRPQQNLQTGLRVATLVGVAVLIFINVTDQSRTREYREELDGRLAQIETDIAQVSEKVEGSAARAQAPARRRGPDPERVYAVKTEGAPVRGAARAPVTIAEFSDFQ